MFSIAFLNKDQVPILINHQFLWTLWYLLRCSLVPMWVCKWSFPKDIVKMSTTWSSTWKIFMMTLPLRNIVLTSSMFRHLSSSWMYFSWHPRVPFKVCLIYICTKRFNSSIMITLKLIIYECNKFFTHDTF